MVEITVDSGDSVQQQQQQQHSSQQPLRILSLIPSATDICVHLGLGDSVVGVTHCCDTEDLPSSVVVVTEDQIRAPTTTQGDIHTKVVENGKKAEDAMGDDDDETKGSPTTTGEIPTLYPIDKDLLKKASPNLIVTQDLCHVCAPSSKTVSMALEEAGIEEARMVLLTPMNLRDVVGNLQEVADAAGVSERGKEKCGELRSRLRRLESLVREKRTGRSTTKRILVMEWIDPPFCGGHWIPDMARLIGTELAIAPDSDGRSRQITWAEIEDSDPDVMIAACCGFDLERNLADVASSGKHFSKLRSCREGKLYAANGDQYFARPSPKLLTGAIIMALCVYNEAEEPDLFRAIRELPFASEALDSYGVFAGC